MILMMVKHFNMMQIYAVFERKLITPELSMGKFQPHQEEVEVMLALTTFCRLFHCAFSKLYTICIFLQSNLLSVCNELFYCCTLVISIVLNRFYFRTQTLHWISTVGTQHRQFIVYKIKLWNLLIWMHRSTNMQN